MQVAGDASSLEGVTTSVEDMMGLETDPGGGSRSTSLSKSVMSPLWDIIVLQSVMITRVARWRS
jgi:hypothetical protein